MQSQLLLFKIMIVSFIQLNKFCFWLLLIVMCSWIMINEITCIHISNEQLKKLYKINIPVETLFGNKSSKVYSAHMYIFSYIRINRVVTVKDPATISRWNALAWVSISNFVTHGSILMFYSSTAFFILHKVIGQSMYIFRVIIYQTTYCV